MQTTNTVQKTIPRWTDSKGQAWRLDLTFALVNGRAECVALSLDSKGSAAVTSQIAREAEQQARHARSSLAKRLLKLHEDQSEVGARARRIEVRAFTEPSGGDHGRAHGHDQWLQRAYVLREAVTRKVPMVQALREAEPGHRPDTYRKIIDRTREKDAENGWGIAPRPRRKK